VSRVLKLTIAYDGTRFVGWQRQAAGESIQELIEGALATFEGAPVTVHGAGRTDAGVHALGQVASVELAAAHDTAAIQRGLNVRLPPEIRILTVEEAASGFHARFSARAKTYQYRIRNASVVSPFERLYVWHVPGPLEVGAMAEAAAALVGTHDFASFQSAGSPITGTVRTIARSTLAREADGLLVYDVEGTGFLRHMVRAIVGTLVEIGQRRRPVSSMASLLAGRTRADAGATAPPHGLFLVHVNYD
jgi:tRNA pseudouridine38-40 synthase